jgi:hypothetical protein
LLFNKKAKALTNNSKNKTLQTTFIFMSHHNTFSTKKKKAPSKKFYQTTICRPNHLSLYSLFFLDETMRGYKQTNKQRRIIFWPSGGLGSLAKFGKHSQYLKTLHNQ